jgi:cobalamin biosynthesis Mg chelatase CobN
MAKENTPEQPASATPKAAQQKLTPKKGATRGSRTQVGGTAVPGAKSTMPKPPPTASNQSQQQQAESYNRDMRRRMQHMGTGPYSEGQRNSPQEKRRKRIERRKQRLEEERARLRRSTPTGRVALGRRSLYFIIVVAAIVVLLIVIFVILRSTHVIA